MGWDKIFTIHIYNKGLVYRTYKGHLPSIFKMAIRLEQKKPTAPSKM